MHSTQPRRPNILLILTDDQGWDDMSVHGNSCVETPHLERLAAESVQFANYYVAPVCAPSRASLLTGRHFIRTGVSHVHGGRDFIHPDEILVSDVFQQAGYATGMWGKWHSGKATGYFPWERGFDEAYMAQLYIHKDSTGRFNGEPRQYRGWTVDTLTDLAIEFMERNADQPFFAFLPHVTIHAPLVTSDELIQKYKDKGVGETLATIYGMVEQLDGSIGRLLDALDRLGIAENTIVLFMSDNGPQYFDSLDEHDLEVRYTSRYKGHKGSMWENGIKSPLFVRCPARFQPRTVQRLADITDIMPTLMDICSIATPPHHAGFDGRSLLPALKGQEALLEAKESLIFSNLGWPPEKNAEDREKARLLEYEPIAPEKKATLPFDEQLMGLRTEAHKLLWRPGYARNAPAAIEGSVLVDMVADPREDTNILPQKPELARELRGKLEDWFELIKREPHSYHNPCFAIGPDTSNIVFAYAPVRLHGHVINGVTSSENWKAAGDAAEYLIDVREAGDYRVSMEYKGLTRGGTRVRLSAGGSALEAALESVDGQTLGLLRLDAGQKVLRFEILAVPEGKEPIFERFMSLSFDAM